jgi:threonine/homoserine/homoserine lactone efflux protein
LFSLLTKDTMVISLVTVGAISFWLALSGALMPGPMLTATISEASKKGFIMGPLIVLGHGLLELALVVAIISGLGTFLKEGWVVAAVALAGSFILFWMGWGMIRQARRHHLQYGSQLAERSRTLHPVVTGVLVSLSNPFWTIWWVTIGVGYMMTAMEYGFVGLAVFFIGHISADLLWFSLVSYGVSTGRKVVGDKLYQRITGLCGLFLILFGLRFLLVGFKYFYYRI